MPLLIKFKKIHFLALFFTIVGVLFVVRLVHPELTAVDAEEVNTEYLADAEIIEPTDSLALSIEEQQEEVGDEEGTALATDSLQATQPADPAETDRVLRHSKKVDAIFQQPRADVKLIDFRGRPIKNKIKGVSSYVRVFNDLNDVQIATASREM